jgi:hypothetical protein
MANQCNSRKPVQSVIHWPTVRAAGGVACFVVLVAMAVIWAQKNPAVVSCRVGRISNPSYTKSETNSKHEIPNEGSIPSQEISQYPEAIAAPTLTSASTPALELADGSGLAERRVGAGVRAGVGTGSQEPGDKNQATNCQSSDSQLEFARDPMEAARLVKEEHKLMFVLHVSGNFEESKFT